MFHSFIAPSWSLEIAVLATWGYLRQTADARSEVIEASLPFSLESVIAEEKWLIAFFLCLFFHAAFVGLRNMNNTSFPDSTQFVMYCFLMELQCQ
jgi:hypothetical protein